MGKNEKNSKKVAALENDYTKEQYVEFQKQQKQLIFRRRRLAAIFLVAFIIFAFSAIQLMKDYHRLGAFKQERADAIAESVAVDKKVKDLKKDVALLKDDDYVAKLARSRFLLSKEGEQIYPTPEQMKKTQTSGAEESKSSSEKNSQSQSSTETTKSSAE